VKKVCTDSHGFEEFSLVTTNGEKMYMAKFMFLESGLNAQNLSTGTHTFEHTDGEVVGLGCSGSAAAGWEYDRKAKTIIMEVLEFDQEVTVDFELKYETGDNVYGTFSLAK